MDPIFGQILGGIISGALSDHKVAPIVAAKVTRAVIQKAEADPVIVNQMNMEMPVQSRVVVGSTIGMIGALIVAMSHLYEMFQTGSLDINLALVEVGTIWGVGYALYGRLWGGGLKPLFSK